MTENPFSKRHLNKDSLFIGKMSSLVEVILIISFLSLSSYYTFVVFIKFFGRNGYCCDGIAFDRFFDRWSINILKLPPTIFVKKIVAAKTDGDKNRIRNDCEYRN